MYYAKRRGSEWCVKKSWWTNDGVRKTYIKGVNKKKKKKEEGTWIDNSLLFIFSEEKAIFSYASKQRYSLEHSGRKYFCILSNRLARFYELENQFLRDYSAVIYKLFAVDLIIARRSPCSLIAFRCLEKVCGTIRSFPRGKKQLEFAWQPHSVHST